MDKQTGTKTNAKLACTGEKLVLSADYQGQPATVVRVGN